MGACVCSRYACARWLSDGEIADDSIERSFGRRRVSVSHSESTDGDGVVFVTPAASSLADAAPHPPPRPSTSPPSSETVPRQGADHCSPPGGNVIADATGPNPMNLATTTVCHRRLQDSDAVLPSRSNLAGGQGTGEGRLDSAGLCVDNDGPNNATQNAAGVAITDHNRPALQSDGLSHPGVHGRDAPATCAGTPAIQTIDARSDGISDGANVGMNKRRLREHHAGARYSLRPRKTGVQLAPGPRHTPDATTSGKPGKRRAKPHTDTIKPIKKRRLIGTFPVDCLLARRGGAEEEQRFLVKWVSRPGTTVTTWEPRGHILDEQMLLDFEEGWQGFDEGVDVLRIRRSAEQWEYLLHWHGRPSKEDGWVSQALISPKLVVKVQGGLYK